MADNTISLLNDINESINRMRSESISLLEKIKNNIEKSNGKSGSQSKSVKVDEIVVEVSKGTSTVLQAVMKGDSGAKNVKQLADSIGVLSDQLKKIDDLKAMDKGGVFTNIAEFMRTLGRMPEIDYVLKQFSDENISQLNKIVNFVVDSIDSTLKKGIDVDTAVKVGDVYSSFFTSLGDIPNIADLVYGMDDKNIDKLSNFIKKMQDLIDKMPKVDAKDKEFHHFDSIEAMNLITFMASDKLKWRLLKANMNMKLGAGKMLKNFFEEISKIMTDENVKSLEDNKAILAVTQSILMLTDPKVMKQIWFSRFFLTEKAGQRIGSFFLSLSKQLKSIEDPKKTATAIESLSKSMKVLSSAIAILTSISLVLVMLGPAAALLTIAMTSLLIRGTLLILKKIADFIEEHKDLKGSVREYERLVYSLLAVITTVGMLSILLDKFGGIEGLSLTIGALIGITVAFGILFLLINKINPEKRRKDVKDFAEAIALLTVSLLLIAVTAAIVQNISTEALHNTGLIIAAEIIIMAAIWFFVKFTKKGLRKSLLSFAEAVAMLTVSLVLIAISALIAAQIKNNNLLPLLAVVGAMLGIMLGIWAFFHFAPETGVALVYFGACVALIAIAMVLIAVTALLAKNIGLEEAFYTGLIILAVIGIMRAIKAYMIMNPDIGLQMAYFVGTVLALIGCVALLIIVTKMAKQLMDWEGLGITVLLFGIIAALIFGIKYIIAKIATISDIALVQLAKLEAVIFGLIALVSAMVLLFKFASTLSLEDLGRGSAAVAAGFVVMGVIAAALVGVSTFAAPLIPILAMMEVALGGIVLLGFGILGLIKIFVNAENEYGGEGSLTAAGDRLSTMFVSFINNFASVTMIAAAMALAVSAPFITAGLLMLTPSLFLFMHFIKKTKKLLDELGDTGSEDSNPITKIGNTLAVGFTSFINTLANSFSFGSIAMLTILRFVNGPMKSLMKSVGIFVDMVVKVATMQFVTGYDNNGKPVYEKVADTAFSDAAGKITAGFSVFIVFIGAVFNTLSIKSMIAIKLLANSMEPIMNAIYKFAKAIQLLTTSTYTITDENGNKKTEVITGAAIQKAGEVLSQNFDKFITSLMTNIKPLEWNARMAMKSLRKAIGPVMDSTYKYAQAIVKLATGTYTITDENGKQITKKLDSKDYTSAANILIDNIKSFITQLSTSASKLSGDSIDAVKALSKSLDPVMSSVGKYVDAIMKLAGGTYTVTENGKDIKKRLDPKTDFITAAKTVGDMIVEFIQYFTIKLKDIDLDDFSDTIKQLDPLINAVSKYVQMIVDLDSKFVISGYDKDGKPIYKKDINGELIPVDIKKISENVSNRLIDFVKAFTTSWSTNDMQAKIKQVKDTMTGNIEPIIKVVNKFANSLSEFSKNDFTKIASSQQEFCRILSNFFNFDFTQGVNRFATNTNTLIKSLNNLNKTLAASIAKFNAFGKTFDKTVRGINDSLRKTEEKRNKYLNTFAYKLGNVAKQLQNIKNLSIDINSQNFNNIKDLAQSFTDMQKELVSEVVSNVYAQVADKFNAGAFAGSYSGASTPASSGSSNNGSNNVYINSARESGDSNAAITVKFDGFPEELRGYLTRHR